MSCLPLCLLLLIHTVLLLLRVKGPSLSGWRGATHWSFGIVSGLVLHAPKDVRFVLRTAKRENTTAHALKIISIVMPCVEQATAFA